jgi:hypothetical protein
MKKLLLAIIICSCAGNTPKPDPGPEPPTDVRFHDYTLSWDRNTEEDLSHYLAHHGHDSANFANVQMVLDTFALWPDLDGTRNHVFAAQAVDFAGNVSDLSEVVFVERWWDIDSDTMYAGDSRVTARNAIVIQKGQWGDPPWSIPGWHIWQVAKNQTAELEFQITGKAIDIYYLAGEDDWQDVQVFVDGNQVLDLDIADGDDQPHWAKSSPFDVVDKQCLITIKTGGEYFRAAVIVIEK